MLVIFALGSLHAFTPTKLHALIFLAGLCLHWVILYKCASIRVIETNSISDIRKLVAYWVLFSLISFFDRTFSKILEW
ncbi:unnamed protein product, partial [Vitis vinifera]